jgi:hypothetical protein
VADALAKLARNNDDCSSINKLAPEVRDLVTLDVNLGVTMII